MTRDPSRRGRGPLIAASLLAVVVLLAACGSGSGTAGTSGSTAASGAGNGGGQGGQSGQAAAPRREYPAGGPSDPVFPPGKDAYSQVAAQKCGELLKQTQTWVAQNVPDAEGKDTTPLYMSAAYACLGQWDDAVRTFGEIGTPPDFGDNCARKAMLSWLTALINERKKDPTFSPVFITSKSPSPCKADSTSTSPDDGTTSSSSTTTTDSSTTTTTS